MFSLSIKALAFVFFALIGFVFAYLPAGRIARLDYIEGLRRG